MASSGLQEVSSRRREIEAAIRPTVERALDAGEIGLGVSAYHNGELVADIYMGIADPDIGDQVTSETLFWLASVAKTFVAIALHIQVERGLVAYDAPIARYWPEFAVHGKDRATVQDLLSHRAGIPSFPITATAESICDYASTANSIAAMHPLYEPGTRNAYHSYTFGYVIAEIVRRTDPDGRGISTFVEQEIFEPMGVNDLWIGIPEEVEPRVAPYRVEIDPQAFAKGMGYEYDVIQAVPAAVAPPSGIFNLSAVRRACIPSAGAIGNAASVARVWAMIANEGELDGVRILSPDTVGLISAPRPPGWDLTLGKRLKSSIGGFWLPNDEDRSTSPMGPERLRVFGQPGAGGSIGWCDVSNRVAVAITTNRLAARQTAEGNPLAAIGTAVRAALGID